MHLVPSRRVFLFIAWTLFGLVYGMLQRLGAGSRSSWEMALLPTLASAWFWFVATPVLARIARWMRSSGQPWWRAVLIHLVLAAAMVFVTGLLQWGVRSMLYSQTASLWARIFLTGDVTLVQYVMVVVIERAWSRHQILARGEKHALMLEEQLVRARLVYLERQLRPHFLFNSLNAIAEMAHTAPLAAQRMIASLRRLLTSAIETAGRPQIPLHEELETLGAYLDLQRARFDDALIVEIIVDEHARGALVPPLLLQPVVENAIQHGLDRTEGAGRVRTTISVRGDRLSIEVEDNGASTVPRVSGFGIGLRNTRERIETLYGQRNCSLELELRPAGGAITRIQLPLEQGRPERGEGAALEERNDASRSLAALGTTALPPTNVTAEFQVQTRAPRTPMSTTRRLMIAWSICLAAPFFWSTQIYFLFLALEGRATFELSGPDSVAAAAWAIMAPIGLYLAERFPVRGEHWRRNLTIHLVMAAAASIFEGLIVTSTGLHGTRPILAAVNAPQRTLDMVAYLSLVGWTHAEVFAQWFRERAIVAARLSAQIEQARWRAATIDLQPGLVLSALDAAEREVVTSAEGAEDMLYHLAELLRSQLELSRDALIPLDAEVRQLQIAEKLRARIGAPGPWLSVTSSPQLSTVEVPSGVLRHLVRAICAGMEPDERLELRLDAIRFQRQRMEMQLTLLHDGVLIGEAASAEIALSVAEYDVSLMHTEVLVEGAGNVSVVTDLAAFEPHGAGAKPSFHAQQEDEVSALIPAEAVHR